MKKEYLWVALGILILNLFSYVPILQNYLRAPADRYYWGGSGEEPIDAVGNLDTIREGYLGDWYRTPPDTSTITTIPTALKFEYIAIGQIGRLLKIDPLIMYYLSRLLLSTATMLVIYGIIRSVFTTPLQRVVSLLFALFATSIIFPVEWSQNILINLSADVSVFIRLTSAAHHYLLGILLSLGSVYFLGKALDNPHRIRFLLLAIVLGIACGLTNAPSILPVLLSIPIFFLIRLTQYPVKKILTRDIPTLASYAIGVSLSFVYLKFMSQFFNYNALARTEQMVGFNPMPQFYVYAVGIPYIFSWFAIPYILKKKQTILTLLLPWIVVHPIATFTIAPILNMNKSRLFVTAYFVVFAILAVAGLTYIATLIRRVIHAKNLTFWVFLVAAVLTLGSGFFAYQKSSARLHVHYTIEEDFAFGYPKRKFMDAVWWLRDHTQKNDIVLSDIYAGTLIPAFAGNRVLISFWFLIESPELFYKTYPQVLKFYSRAMSDSEASAFLRNNSISYVVVRFEEQLPLTPIRGLSYPALTEVLKNDTAVVYEVK
ncbi:MAG: hypothetical protein NT149_01360 [Candidatus Gottesmanbacteria bacterium]|nr:hypothetical protein [Candidatus Gottesmanbacteria bacterium]